MMEYILSGVVSNHVPEVWDDVKHFVQVALDKTEGEIGLKDVYKSILDKDMQLWTLNDEGPYPIGALVTQIINYPQKKACRYVTLGGDVHGDFDVITKIIERWAKSNGCERMEIIGRKGWTKSLKKLGYAEAYSYVTKDMSDE
jgi:hypothetical protein